MKLRPILLAIMIGLLLGSCGPSQAGRGLPASETETAAPAPPTPSIPTATAPAEPLLAPRSVPAAIDRAVPAPQVISPGLQSRTEPYPQSPQAVVQSFLRGFQ